MNSRQAAKHFLVWVLVFCAWSVWESCIRILLQHEAWSLRSSFSFLAWNLAPALALGIFAGILHTLLALLILWKRPGASWIVAPAPTAIAVSIVISLLFDSSQSWNAIPGFLQVRSLFGLQQQWMLYVFAVGLSLAVIAGSLFAGRWFSRFRPGHFAPFAFILLPLVIVLVVQGYRNTAGARKAAARGPVQKVIVISIDTLRADYVGAYGNTSAQTPVLDRIAAEGARFEQAVSSIPQTGPSHASMMTGMTPLSHGLHHNGYPLSARHWTLAEQLRAAGFRTAAFISGIPMKADFSGLDQGFQEYHDQLAPVDYISHTFYGRSVVPFFQRGLLRRAQATTDPALEWLSRNTDAPFFLFLHYFDPHYPYGRKEGGRFHGDPFIVRTGPEDVANQKRLYAAEVAYVDQHIGRIVSHLQQAGIYDDVLFLVTSDHGESLGEHNYYYDHDRYVYEQLVRVPFLLRCPKLVKANTVVHPQVAVLDVYQTVLGATGVAPSNKVEGQDVIALTRGIPAEYLNRSILSHSFYFGVHGIRTNEWKLIARKRRFELFDLIEDPQELHNLYRHQRDVSEAMKTSLAAALRGLNTSEDATKDLTPEQLEDLKSLGYFQ